MDISVLENISLIPELLTEIQRLSQKLECNEGMKQEWYNLEQCWELKGGCTLSTMKAKLYLQPCRGIAEAKIGGRKCWRKETVKKWLSMTDSDLILEEKKCSEQ